MENMGLLAAAGAALAWGSYSVPFKKSKSADILQFQALMSLGILIFYSSVSLLFNFPLSFNIYGLLAGILWALGNVLSLVAISNIGISRAIPVWTSTAIMVPFLLGVFILKELTSTSGIILAVMGVFLITLGVFLVSITGHPEQKNIKKGILAALLAGIFFGTYLAPLKLTHLQSTEIFFPMSLGIVFVGLGYFLIKGKKFKNEAVISGLFGGTIWSVGNLLGVISISLLGLAKGYSIAQSAVLVSVLWGLFYFKEAVQKKDLIKILTGAVVLLIGVILLTLSR